MQLSVTSVIEPDPKGRRDPLRPTKTHTEEVMCSLDRAMAAARAELDADEEDVLSTDDNPVLEYSTPRGYALGWHTREENLAFLNRFRPKRLPFEPALNAAQEAHVKDAIRRYFQEDDDG